MIYGIMKLVKVTLKNLSNQISEVVFEGRVKDDDRVISYKDRNGTLSYINFSQNDTLEIHRTAKDYSTKMIINREHPSLAIVNQQGTLDLPLKVSGLSIKENRVYACYDTGEKIEIMISLVKE